MYTDPGTIYIAHRHMNVEIGAEAALFPEKEHISGILLAVGGSRIRGEVGNAKGGFDSLTVGGGGREGSGIGSGTVGVGRN